MDKYSDILKQFADALEAAFDKEDYYEAFQICIRLVKFTYEIMSYLWTRIS